MREIKFRAWDGKKMHDWDWLLSPINWDLPSRLAAIFEKGWDKEIGKCALMQFTGLHDKNDKEIYEGDIVKQKNSTWNWMGVIKFGYYDVDDMQDCGCQEVYGWYMDGESKRVDGSAYEDIRSIDEGVTVIGNIYENPELLEAE